MLILYILEFHRWYARKMKVKCWVRKPHTEQRSINEILNKLRTLYIRLSLLFSGICTLKKLRAYRLKHFFFQHTSKEHYFTAVPQYDFHMPTWSNDKQITSRNLHLGISGIPYCILFLMNNFMSIYIVRSHLIKLLFSLKATLPIEQWQTYYTSWKHCCEDFYVMFFSVLSRIQGLRHLRTTVA